MNKNTVDSVSGTPNNHKQFSSVDQTSQQAPSKIAIELATNHSLSIIPLNDKKTPFFKWGPAAPDHGLKNRQIERATVDELEAWEKKHKPAAWAMITGQVSNLFSLDFDGKEGIALLERLGIDPHRRTGRGGFHIDFRYPGWRVKTLNSKTDLELKRRYPGLDVRGDGGFIAICGRNENGPYEWLRPFTLEDYTQLPYEMREYFGLLQPPDQRPIEIRSGPVFTPGQKATLTAQWGIDRIGSAGGRSNAAILLACQLRDNHVSRADAESVMRDFAQMAPVTDAHGAYAPFSEREALAALDQAQTRAARDPWQTKKLTRDIDSLLTDLAQGIEPPREGQAYPLIQFRPHEQERETLLSCLESDEYGDAVLFAKMYRGLVVYDHADKQWYTWQTHYWKRDSVERIRTLVSGRLSAAYIHLQADLLPQESELKARIAEANAESMASEEAEVLKGQLAPIAARIKVLSKRAKELKSASRCRNVLFYAVSMLGISSADDAFKGWDQTPWLLGTKDGVIDLHTGLLRNGQPGDYLRTVTTTKWRGLDTPAPRWERFLQEIFEDRDPQERAVLIAFLQRMLGLGMAGEVIEHVFLMLYGEEGRNGKDTMLEVISRVLGSLVGAVSKDVLLDPGKARPAGSATPHLVALQGKRLAWASEPAEGARFDVGQIKMLTGGGAIPARQLYGKEYSFQPTHLLMVLTNHKPHANAKDKAFWARLCPIVFNLRFLDKAESELASNERLADPRLKSALEQEASGILAWLVKGCMDYQSQGLQIPGSVRAEREKYRQEEDTLALFLRECCERGDNFKIYRVTKTTLLNRYKVWCSDQNLKPLSGPGFSNDLCKIFPYKRIAAGMAFFGIALREQENTLEDDEEMRDVVMPKNYTASQAASGAALSAQRTRGNAENVVFSTNPPSGNNESLTKSTVVGKNYTNYTKKNRKTSEAAPDADAEHKAANVETTQKTERDATQEDEAQLQAYEKDLRVYLKAKNMARVFAVAPLVEKNGYKTPEAMLQIVRAALLSDERAQHMAAIEEMLSRKG